MITFPLQGHSFMAADRCLGRVEQKLRQNPVITTKEEFIKIYLEVGITKRLKHDWKIYNIKVPEKKKIK